MQNEKLLEKLKFVKKVKSLSEAKEYLADLNTDENDVLIYTENNRILCFPGVIKTRQIEDMWEKAQKWCDGDSRDLLLFYYAGTPFLRFFPHIFYLPCFYHSWKA